MSDAEVLHADPAQEEGEAYRNEPLEDQSDPPEEQPDSLRDAAADLLAAQEEHLLERLIQYHGIDPAVVEGLVQEQESSRQHAQQLISGTSFTIHPESRTLYIQDFLSQEVLAVIPLFTDKTGFFNDADPPKLKLLSYDPWGSAFCGVNPANGNLEGFIKADQDYLYGLVITSKTSFLYTASPFETALLGESYQCLYHRVHKGGPPNTAYDMFLSEDRQHLCISDREAGRLMLFSTASHEMLGQVQIRAAGSAKALNVAFDYYEPRLFITDNQSANLYILSLDDLHLEKLSLGQPGQICGNLVRAPDVRYLFVLSLKPSVALLQVEIESGYIEETMPLKGNFFSNQHIDPCDLMVLSPDQNHLLLVTSHSDPSPFTPGIVVVDAQRFVPLRMHPIANALKEQTKPIGLVFPIQNQLVHLQKSRLELLIDKGLVSPESVDELRQNPSVHSRPPLEIVDLDAPDAPSHGQGKVPTLQPLQMDAIVLDPEVAIPAIIELLSQKIYQQCEVELQAHEAELEKVKIAAESYRLRLEHYDSVEVWLEDILGQHTLETYITRQDVLSLMATGVLRSQNAVRPPFHCPSCHHKLRGSWDCPDCHLEIENPTRAERKRLSSLDSLGALSSYHMLLADPKRRRLVILDDNKTIDWELHGAEMSCLSPWSALALHNQNLLVVDKQHNQVFECTPTGNMCWSLDQTMSDDLVLNHPVKVTYFSEEYDEHFLIVDQGHHRVIVVDRKQHLVWQYGVKGEAGSEPGYLDTPSDFQRTFDGTYLIADTGNNRVIEVRDQEIIRSFGSRQGLRSPVYAQRLLEHDTLVVDAENYRVVELDLAGETVRECFYYTEEMGEEMRMDKPSRIFRREKKSVVLMDEDKIIEILPLKRRLIWSSLLKHLAKRVEILRDAFDKSGSYIQSFYQYRMPTLEELIARLREENRLESSNGIAQRIYENLESLIAYRRERDLQRSRTAHANFINETWVQPIPIYVIDRTNQQIVQIDRTGDPHWHFGTLPEYKLSRPTHVTETSNSLLIADTNQNRVLEVALRGQEVIRCFGGKDNPILSKPRSAYRTLIGNTLVSEQGNKRLVEFDPEGNLIWEFHKPREISYPYYALELGKESILYVDWALHVVKEITRKGDLIWSYGQSSRMGNEENMLASPEYAVSLHSGAILIADTGNNRVIEVSPKRKILWEFSTNATYSLNKPNWCQRLSNGNTLIAHQAFRSLLEVNRDGVACWYFELGTEPMVRLA